jgi:DNA-directed RNA polymerase subunit RPC12/RpoP
LSVNKIDDNQLITCPRCQFKSNISRFAEVITQKIVCPKCSVLLTVDPQMKGAITCPRCSYKGDVSLFPDAPPASQDDKDETLGPTRLSDKGKLAKPGMLVLVDGSCRPETIVLQRGLNSIGRKATTSESSIQLETADAYMSKNHIRIELVMKQDFSFEHRLSDSGSRNGTYHNKERMDPGDVIILQPNDTVRIGRTIFKFVVE